MGFIPLSPLKAVVKSKGHWGQLCKGLGGTLYSERDLEDLHEGKPFIHLVLDLSSKNAIKAPLHA